MPPREMEVPLIVREEFWSATLGRLSEEVATEASWPLAVVYTKPLVEKADEVARPPHESVGVVPPEEMTGQVAPTEVTYVPAGCAPIVLYEMVRAEEPSKVEPEAAPPPELLKVAALTTLPALPVMLALSEEVETWYVAPLLAATKPEKLERTGALVNVCVPAHVLEVVVPKASDTVFALFWSGYVKVSADCFELKVVQSPEERQPKVEPFAVSQVTFPPAYVRPVEKVVVAALYTAPTALTASAPLARFSKVAPLEMRRSLVLAVPK